MAEQTTNMADDAVKKANTAKNAVKTVKNVKKASTKAASGNYVGAAIDLAKDENVRRAVGVFLLMGFIFILMVATAIMTVPYSVYEGFVAIQDKVAEWTDVWKEAYYSGNNNPFVAFWNACKAAGSAVFSDIIQSFNNVTNYRFVKQDNSKTRFGSDSDSDNTDETTETDKEVLKATQSAGAVLSRKIDAVKAKMQSRIDEYVAAVKSSLSRTLPSSAMRQQAQAAFDQFVNDPANQEALAVYRTDGEDRITFAPSNYVDIQCTSSNISSNDALRLICLMSAQKNGDPTDIKAYELLKWLGYRTGGLNARFMYNGTSVSVTPWEGDALPQYLYEEYTEVKRSGGDTRVYDRMRFAAGDACINITQPSTFFTLQTLEEAQATGETVEYKQEKNYYPHFFTAAELERGATPYRKRSLGMLPPIYIAIGPPYTAASSDPYLEQVFGGSGLNIPEDGIWAYTMSINVKVIKSLRVTGSYSASFSVDCRNISRVERLLGFTSAAEDAGHRAWIITEDFFDDAVFIGDSITDGLYESAASGKVSLGNAQFICKTGYSLLNASVNSNTTFRGISTPLNTAMINCNANKYYIMLGINDVGWRTTQECKELMRQLINTIRNINNEAEIYLQSLTPVGSNISQFYPQLSNLRISSFNIMLKDLAKNENCAYVDVYSSLSAGGVLPADYSAGDSLHLNSTAHEAWVTALMTSSNYLVNPYHHGINVNLANSWDEVPDAVKHPAPADKRGSVQQIGSTYIYIPYNYSSSKRYNVLMFLHGSGGNGSNCFFMPGSGRISDVSDSTLGKNILDNMIASGACPPLIVVGVSYSDCGNGGAGRDVKSAISNAIGIVQSNYSVYTGRSHYGIYGASLGSYAVETYVIPDMLDYFSWIGSFSNGSGSYRRGASAISSGPNIDMLYVGQANNDPARGTKQQHQRAYDAYCATGKVTDGQNGKIHFLTSGGHSWYTWSTYLYNMLQMFFD